MNSNTVSKNIIVEDNMKKVSIIIPAYNAGKFLTPMLDSIAAQTYTNLEVIVAYDIKSTDNTIEILKSYKGIQNLVVDEAKDSSSGQARNRGFKLATGDYIIFLDADDKIIPTYISDLIHVFNEFPELNVVCGNRIHATEEEILEKYSMAIQSERHIEKYSQKIALRHLLYRDTLAGAPWTWLVKREYIIENNISFPDYSHGDDTVWIFQLILGSDSIGYCSKIGYVFIQHPTSITNSIFSPTDYWQKYEKYRRDIVEMLSHKYSDLANDFQNLEKRNLIRKMTRLSYNDFQKTLDKIDIHRLNPTQDDKLMSRLSIIGFNISKYAYWRICRLKVMEKYI